MSQRRDPKGDGLDHSDHQYQHHGQQYWGNRGQNRHQQPMMPHMPPPQRFIHQQGPPPLPHQVPHQFVPQGPPQPGADMSQLQQQGMFQPQYIQYAPQMMASPDGLIWPHHHQGQMTPQTLGQFNNMQAHGHQQSLEVANQMYMMTAQQQAAAASFATGFPGFISPNQPLPPHPQHHLPPPPSSPLVAPQMAGHDYSLSQPQWPQQHFYPMDYMTLKNMESAMSNMNIGNHVHPSMPHPAIVPNCDLDDFNKRNNNNSWISGGKKGNNKSYPNKSTTSYPHNSSNHRSAPMEVPSIPHETGVSSSTDHPSSCVPKEPTPSTVDGGTIESPDDKAALLPTPPPSTSSSSVSWAASSPPNRQSTTSTSHPTVPSSSAKGSTPITSCSSNPSNEPVSSIGKVPSPSTGVSGTKVVPSGDENSIKGIDKADVEPRNSSKQQSMLSDRGNPPNRSSHDRSSGHHYGGGFQGNPHPREGGGAHYSNFHNQKQRFNHSSQHQNPNPNRSNPNEPELEGGRRQETSVGAASSSCLTKMAGDSSTNPHSDDGKKDLAEQTRLMAQQYNPKEELDVTNGRFFVIKSFTEDDIHRSIKYSIWCSTEYGNKRLDEAFRQHKGPIYLFFSVNKSGYFCGIGQMLSSLDYQASTGVWSQNKYKGQFKVKWIYVKDVPNKELQHITLENNENKPVTFSRDTQEIPMEKGQKVISVIHHYRHETSIFDDFIHYEEKEGEDARKQRNHPPHYQQNQYHNVRPSHHQHHHQNQYHNSHQYGNHHQQNQYHNVRPHQYEGRNYYQQNGFPPPMFPRNPYHQHQNRTPAPSSQGPNSSHPHPAGINLPPPFSGGGTSSVRRLEN